MKMKRCLQVITPALLLTMLLLLATPTFAATSPDLGTAASFAVLAGSTVTNTGATNLNGDLGVSPGSTVTGFPPGTMTGSIHAGDAVAQQAQNDVTSAYNDAAGQPCDSNLNGQDLGGLTLTSAAYCFTSSAQLTGQLTLDAQGNPASVFIFQIGSTLTTASNSSILLINGAQACNIFWQIGSSATLGTNTSFKGSILALTSITLNTAASSTGGLYARNGAVTLDTSSIQACALPAATATPVALATATPPLTATPVPSASETLTPIATDTPLPRATRPLPEDTAVPQATNTNPPSNTQVVAPSDTPLVQLTNQPTAMATTTIVLTDTPGAGSTGTATVVPNITTTIALTSTPAPNLTTTPLMITTATAVPALTASPTPYATPVVPIVGLPHTGSTERGASITILIILLLGGLLIWAGLRLAQLAPKHRGQ